MHFYKNVQSILAGQSHKTSQIRWLSVHQACLKWPELNQPLFQFINAMHGRLVNRLLHGRLYLTVNWVEVWAVQRS